MRRSYTMRVRIGFDHKSVLHGRGWRGVTTLYRDDTLVLERTVPGTNRRAAVTVALNWLWVHLGHQLGQAQTLLTVDNPYEEVKYSTSFHCRAREYCYLDEITVTQLLLEANGELVRETRLRALHHPYGSVRRIKRRRKLPARVAPNVYADANNTFFYRYTHVPQHSKKGKFIRYRKVRFLRLEARGLSSAIKEIKDRDLPALHKSRRILGDIRSVSRLESLYTNVSLRT